MRQLTSRGLAACVVTAIVALGACGGPGESNKVASVSGKSKNAAHAKQGKTDVRRAFLAFARCMREHGVNMPDPQFDDQGRAMMTQSNSVKNGGADPGKQQAADAACRHFIANAVQNGGNVDPAEEAKMRKQQLSFAKCMRAHGIDMPDPKFSAGGGVSISIGGGIDANSPRFRSAQSTCQTQAGLPKMGPSTGKGGPGIGLQTGGSK